MRTGINLLGLVLALAAGATVLTGCGRKNLPVAPRSVASPVGAPGSTNDDSPSSLANFQRSNRVTSSGGSDLRITPAEVARNPGAPKRRFLLDGLLN